MNRPLKGGRYFRDADTGKLTTADDAKQAPVTDGAETPAQAAEPAKKGK